MDDRTKPKIRIGHHNSMTAHEHIAGKHSAITNNRIMAAMSVSKNNAIMINNRIVSSSGVNRDMIRNIATVSNLDAVVPRMPVLAMLGRPT